MVTMSDLMESTGFVPLGAGGDGRSSNQLWSCLCFTADSKHVLLLRHLNSWV